MTDRCNGLRRGAAVCSPLLLTILLLFLSLMQLSSAASCSVDSHSDEIIEFANRIQQARGDVLFFASVTRKADRSSEEFLCIYQIAEQISMLHGMLVRSSLLLFDTGNRIDYVGEVKIDYDDPSAFVNQITVVRTLQNADGTYMIGRWDEAPSSARTPRVNTPDWITKPPEQPGLLFGVGSIQRRTLEDFSFREADQEAFAQLSNILLNRTYDGRIDLQTGGFGYASVTEQKSEVFLQGARVIARWRDAGKQTYYSLAFCPVPE